ncbi:MAG: hypothetical protein KAT32_04515 [Candidatus Moranbacteria bacterium]|nr:hypothetical protein [Candidatus Moranbacteria bacterium]
MTITFMIKNDAEWYDKMFFVLSCMALLLKLKHYNITYQYEKKEEDGYIKYTFTFSEDADRGVIDALIKECKLC